MQSRPQRCPTFSVVRFSALVFFLEFDHSPNMAPAADDVIKDLQFSGFQLFQENLAFLSAALSNIRSFVLLSDHETR